MVRRERGAAMVEMAIMLPLLLLVLIGIVDFGRLFLAEIMVTNAAREGARMVAMGYDTTKATTRVEKAALPGISTYGGLAAPTFVVPANCSSSPAPTDFASATVKTADFQWIAIDNIVGLFGVALATPKPSATATMRCLG